METPVPGTARIVTADDYHWLEQDCPVCEKPPSRFVGYRGGEAHRQKAGVRCKVWQCHGCGLYFPNPMPHPKGGLAQHYEVDAGEYFIHHDEAAKRARCRAMLSVAARLVGGPGRLLDVGCGRGEMLAEAKVLGWSSVGLEPSRSFADYSRKTTGAEVLPLTIEDSGLPSASFDVVILSAILEHLYHPDTAIREISRLLRPGGALFLEVPNERGFFFQAGNLYHQIRGTGWTVHLSPTFAPFHIFGFGPRSLRALLLKHRLEPRVWRVFAGGNVTPRMGGFRGLLEQVGTDVAIALSSVGSLGNYIESWAVRQ